jgi:hypothetical protein
MLPTYRATLCGEQLQWEEANADRPSFTQSVKVLVTVLDRVAEVPDRERGQRMAGALRKLSSRNALADIADPGQWEREARQDRPLPGREG